jgi:hypothetical protein
MFNTNTNISIFGNSNNTYNGYGINKLDNLDHCNYQIVFDKLINNLTIYLKSFSSGDFKTLLETLTRTQVRILGRKIYEIQKQIAFSSESKFQNKLRLFLKEVLEGLQMSIITYNNYEVLKLESAEAFKKAEILDDQDKLIKYITEKNKNKYSFIDDITITTTKLNIKVEYQLYIDLYGFPTNGIFDQDLLNEIIDKYNL